jgi:hypothetical protein
LEGKYEILPDEEENLSIYLSIAVSLIALLTMIAGCKSRDNAILPVVPDQPVIPERIINPNDYNSRIGKRDDTLGIRFEITGPAQYLLSELDPPQITETRPVFSARLINIPSEPSSSDFDAFIDYKRVFFNFNPLSNEINFTPTDAFKDGKHTASLIYKHQNGSDCACFWSFEVVTRPPEITVVLRTQVDDHLVVMFDRPVEPSQFKDTARWIVNGRRGILKSNIQHEVGSMIIFLPLNNLEFSLFESQVGPLTLSFASDQGNSDYVIRRVGEERRVQDNPCWGHCDDIEIHFDEEHHSLETEDYGFSYRVHQPIPGWCLQVLWAGWEITPVKNDNPRLNYDQDQDNSTVDATLIGLPGMSHPLVMLPWTGTDEDGHTIKAPRQYFHSFSIEYWGDCNDGERPDGSDFETKLAEKSYSFGSGTDINNPVFINEPTVLYGDEAADLITTWMQNIPMLGEAVSGDVYCYSMSRQYMNDFFLQDLRDNECDLYIVARIADPLGAGYGFINQNHVSLDKKFTDPSTGQITYEFGPLHGDQYFGISMDHHPWGGRFSGSTEDLELDPNWPDEDEPGMVQEGGYLQDWTPEEDFIYFVNLTDILMAGSGGNITGVRVRVTDFAGGPGSPHPGNWIRSDNVMEQLCSFTERQGQSRTAMFFGCSPETTRLQVKFIDDNPYDDDEVNEVTYSHLKEVKYAVDTNDDITSFIYLRDEQGFARVHFYVYVPDDIKLNPQFEAISVTFTSSESKIPAGFKKSVSIPAYEISDLETAKIYRLKHLFGLDGIETKMCHFFAGTVMISDHYASEFINYVSSSDHQIPSLSDKADYAISIAEGTGKDSMGNDTWELVTPEDAAKKFRFGTFRGLGFNEPDPLEGPKKWYSYDEFLTSGGIEILKGESIAGNYGFVEVPKIAVQSQADVMLIFGHGLTDAIDYLSLAGTFTYPGYAGQMDNYSYWEENAKYHFAKFVLKPGDTYCIPGKTICNDYGYQGISGWWSDFWLNDPRTTGEPDTKWLTIVGCTALAENSTYQPALNWKKVIDLGYLYSVCGFNAMVDAEEGIFSSLYPGNYVKNGSFTDKYGWYMRTLLAKYDTFQPSGPCYKEIKFWADPNEISTDLSVSAYMEAACELAGEIKLGGGIVTNDFQDFYLHKAVGIDKDNNGLYYYYYLKKVEKPYTVGMWPNQKTYNLSIYRKVI